MDVYTHFRHTFKFKQLEKWILHPMTPLSMLYFVRQVPFKWCLDSTGLAVIRLGFGYWNLTRLSKIMWLITVLSWFNRRGQLIFHVGPGRFGQLFSLIKLNHHLKTAFCIYFHYVWWSESFKCDKYAKKKKKKKTQGGGKNLFTALYIHIRIYL